MDDNIIIHKDPKVVTAIVALHKEEIRDFKVYRLNEHILLDIYFTIKEDKKI